MSAQDSTGSVELCNALPHTKMTTLFEMTPTNEDIFNMTVPSGEPCGCYENRGCLVSMYCSCECTCCLVQRLVDASKTCYTCRQHKAVKWIEYTDLNGDESMRRVCIDCYRTHLVDTGLLEPIEEDEDEEDIDSDTESEADYYYRVTAGGRIEYRDEEPEIDPADEAAQEAWYAMDDEERRDYWEAYWYRVENGSI